MYYDCLPSAAASWAAIFKSALTEENKKKEDFSEVFWALVTHMVRCARRCCVTMYSFMAHQVILHAPESECEKVLEALMENCIGLGNMFGKSAAVFVKVVSHFTFSTTRIFLRKASIHFTRINFLEGLREYPSLILVGGIAGIAQSTVEKYYACGTYEPMCASLLHKVIDVVVYEQGRVAQVIYGIVDLVGALLKRCSACKFSDLQRDTMHKVLRLASPAPDLASHCRLLDLEKVFVDTKAGDGKYAGAGNVSASGSMVRTMAPRWISFASAKAQVRAAYMRLSKALHRHACELTPPELVTRRGQYARRCNSVVRLLDVMPPTARLLGTQTQIEPPGGCSTVHPHRTTMQLGAQCYIGCALNIILGSPFTQALVLNLAVGLKTKVPAVFEKICDYRRGIIELGLPWSLQVLRYLLPRLGMLWQPPNPVLDALNRLEQVGRPQLGWEQGGYAAHALMSMLKSLGLTVLAGHFWKMPVSAAEDVLCCFTHTHLDKVRNCKTDEEEKSRCPNWRLVGAIFRVASSSFSHFVAGTRWDAHANGTWIIDSEAQLPISLDWVHLPAADVKDRLKDLFCNGKSECVSSEFTVETISIWLSTSLCNNIGSPENKVMDCLRSKMLNSSSLFL